MPVSLTTRHHRPDDPGDFVGQSDRRDFPWPALQQSQQPSSGRLPPWLGDADHRRCPHHQQLAQPLIAGFTDPPQAMLAPRGMLPWRQPEPGREMPPALEVCRVDRQRHGDRGDRPDNNLHRDFAGVQLKGMAPRRRIGRGRDRPGARVV